MTPDSLSYTVDSAASMAPNNSVIPSTPGHEESLVARIAGLSLERLEAGADHQQPEDGPDHGRQQAPALSQQLEHFALEHSDDGAG